MKKFLAMLLVAFMLISVVACSSEDADNSSAEASNVNSEASSEESTAADDNVIAPEVAEGTLGKTLWDAFVTAKNENASATTEELANTLVTNPAIQFMGGAMAIEDGAEFFTGFGEYKITGYESAAVYMPMIGSIAFVGYVFELAEGADVNAFIKNLNDNCDPRWNICVTADQTVIGAVDNTVFFLMCPTAIEGEGAPDMSFNTEVIYPITLEEGTVGYTVWTAFEDIMIEGALTTPEEIANEIIAKEVYPASLAAMAVEPGLLTGFDNYEVTEFSSGAVFMPMIGSIPFVGYILEVNEGIDVANYIDGLTANANPNWNICVTADEVLAGAYGNTVFFLMCPKSAE